MAFAVTLDSFIGGTHPKMRNACIVVLLLAISCFGQAPEGTIVGTVRDTQGARIANANVSTEGVSFSFSRSVIANNAREFRLAALLPGRYRLHVESPGFAAQDVTVLVAVGGNPPVQVVMGSALSLVGEHCSYIATMSRAIRRSP